MKNLSQQLLLGTYLLREGRFQPDPLMREMKAWIADPTRPLSERLLELGVITKEEIDNLESLVTLSPRWKPAETSSVSSIEQVSTEVIPENCSNTGQALSDDASQVSLETIPRPGTDEYPIQHGGVTHRATTDSCRFAVLEQHACGGLGVVYRAVDGELDRVVALKRMRRDRRTEASLRERFLLEGRLTGQLEHPGIVPVYGLGIDEFGEPYYAMRFIQGVELRDAIRNLHIKRREQGLPLVTAEFRQLLRRLLDACDAVAYAHSKNVLHRDLKTSNILLGDFGETFVVDWGLAKVIDEQSSDGEIPAVPENEEAYAGPSGRTQHGDFLGTLPYASPEQLRGRIELWSSAMDVYSLGAIFYELLTGRTPLPGNVHSVEGALQWLEEGKVPSANSIVNDCPASLQAVYAKAMDLDPTRRYPSVVDFRKDLEAWLEDEPMQAYPDSVSMRWKRWARRHPRTVATLLSVLLITTLASLILWGFSDMKNRQIQRERNEAIAARNDAEAVQNFLVQTLEQSDPDMGGEKLTVAQSLRNSERGLRYDSTLNLRIKVKVGQAILGSYGPLGLLEDTARMKDMLQEWADALMPTDPISAIEAMFKVAEGEYYLGNTQEALKLAENHLGAYQDLIGENDRRYLAALANYALFKGLLNEGAEQEQILRKIQEAYRSMGLENSMDALVNTANLAAIIAGRDPSEAVDMLHSAQKIASETLGPNHTTTLLLQYNLANFLGSPSDKVPWLKKAYEGRKTVLGEKHFDTFVAGATYGSTLNELYQWDEAVPQLREAIEHSKGIPNRFNFFGRGCYRMLIFALLMQGDGAGAESVAREWIAIDPDAQDAQDQLNRKFWLVEAQVLQGISEANESLDVLLAENPASAGWKSDYLYGRIAMNERNMIDAQRHLENAEKKVQEGSGNHVSRAYAIKIAKCLETTYAKLGDMESQKRIESFLQATANANAISGP